MTDVDLNGHGGDKRVRAMVRVTSSHPQFDQDLGIFKLAFGVLCSQLSLLLFRCLLDTLSHGKQKAPVVRRKPSSCTRRSFQVKL